MRKILFAIAMITIFIQGCDKSNSFLPEDWPGEDLPHYEMDEEFKAYFRPANENSQYIYIDTITGETDTMIITSITESFGVAGSPYTGEGYRIFFESTNTGTFRVRLETTDTYSYYEHIYPIGKGCSVSNENGEISSDLGGSNYITYVDSVNLLGQIYFDVLKIYTDDMYYDELWFAKGIGIILKKATATTTEGTYLLTTYNLK